MAHFLRYLCLVAAWALIGCDATENKATVAALESTREILENRTRRLENSTDPAAQWCAAALKRALTEIGSNGSKGLSTPQLLLAVLDRVQHGPTLELNWLELGFTA